MEEKLFEVHANADVSISSSNNNNTTIIKARRLSMQGNINSHSSSSTTFDSSLYVGSVLLFLRLPMEWEWIIKHFRYTRVLSIEKLSFHISIIPKEIEKLIFLRHLEISPSDGKPVFIDSIPSSICKLLYLETIHIRGHVGKPLPKSIWMMKQLRHLNVTQGMQLSNPWTTKGDHDRRASTNFQVISSLVVGSITELLFRNSLLLFPNLRKLHLTHRYGVLEENQYSDVSKILASLQGSNNNLQYLKNLKLENLRFGHALDLFPSLLTKITLKRCSCLDLDHLKILGKLPSLRILKIIDRIDSVYNSLERLQMISFMADEFLQLEVFQMICWDIERWEMEMHAMPNLQRLVIKDCPRLRNLPHQLWSLSHLRLVEVSKISQELNRELNELKMKKGCKLIIY